MTRDKFEELLASLAENWTNRNYEAVAVNFAEDVFYSDSLNYTFFNRASLLKFFCDDGGCDQFCEFHNAVFDEARQIGTAEYTYEGTHRYHGTVWVEIANGKIATWREYQHKSELDWEAFWKTDERDRS